MDLQPYYQMVEEVIQELGVNPENTRGEKPGQWDLSKGSAPVMVDVFEYEGRGYFQCLAPVSLIPEDRKTEFYEEVLEIGHKLFGVGFTKFKDKIYIKALRETDNLDKSEIMATFNRVGNYADEYDDYFKNKYFGDGERGERS